MLYFYYNHIPLPRGGGFLFRWNVLTEGYRKGRGVVVYVKGEAAILFFFIISLYVLNIIVTFAPS